MLRSPVIQSFDCIVIKSKQFVNSRYALSFSTVQYSIYFRKQSRTVSKMWSEQSSATVHPLFGIVLLMQLYCTVLYSRHSRALRIMSMTACARQHLFIWNYLTIANIVRSLFTCEWSYGYASHIPATRNSLWNVNHSLSLIFPSLPLLVLLL